jgi:predicted AlkP superfamily pyrophosphatase or phosphodiesterase
VHGEKVWEAARKRDRSVTCANLFWWFNMYSSAEYSITPRPMYKADGRKIPDIYTEPPELRHALQNRLGTFPLFNFWGPASSIESSRWIASAAMAVHQQHNPTLTLVYLPHLDYALQRLGPDDPHTRGEVAAIDSVLGDLIDYFDRAGVRMVIVSEYGIEAVDDSIHINRHLREAGLLQVREEQGLEMLDAGASAAFAVADHQIAHVYVNDAGRIEHVAGLCRSIPGIEQVLDRQAQASVGLDHSRSGEQVLVADGRHWFSYDYWLDDARAPDFARTVDIHRKPGYDPVELFLDPRIWFPKLKIGRQLLLRKLGLRTLLDVIPLDTTLVRGSHGRTEQQRQFKPVLMTSDDCARFPEVLSCRDVHGVILERLGLGEQA